MVPSSCESLALLHSSSAKVRYCSGNGLKILASYPGGHATLADLKRDMAVLITSGNGWAKRLAARVPGLDIFSQGLVERLHGGWKTPSEGGQSWHR
jgi:hypothetical protein